MKIGRHKLRERKKWKSDQGESKKYSKLHLRSQFTGFCVFYQMFSIGTKLICFFFWERSLVNTNLWELTLTTSDSILSWDHAKRSFPELVQVGIKLKVFPQCSCLIETHFKREIDQIISLPSIWLDFVDETECWELKVIGFPWNQIACVRVSVCVFRMPEMRLCEDILFISFHHLYQNIFPCFLIVLYQSKMKIGTGNRQLV